MILDLPLITTIQFSIDEWVLILFIFLFLVLFILGAVYHPIFLVFDGIVGMFMAYDVWVFTNNETLAAVFFGFAIMMFIIGIFVFVEEEAL